MAPAGTNRGCLLDSESVDMGSWLELVAHRDVAGPLAAAVVVAGLTVCLLGLRLWRVVLTAVAFAAGCAAGCTLAVSRAPDQPVVVIGLGVAMGCVLTVILAGLPRLGTFAVLAAVGWFAGRLLAGQAHVREQDLMVVCGLAGALVVGLVPTYFDIEKPAVILVSALAGAWAVVWGTTFFFGADFHRVANAAELLASAQTYRGELLVVVVLALLGLVLQTTALLRAGPDAEALRHAMEIADLRTKRRVAVLEELRADGLITRGEYYRHLVRILSTGSDGRMRRAVQPTPSSASLATPAGDGPEYGPRRHGPATAAALQPAPLSTPHTPPAGKSSFQRLAERMAAIRSPRSRRKRESDQLRPSINRPT